MSGNAFAKWSFTSLLFFILFSGTSFPLTDMQLQAINELAIKTNMTNTTLIAMLEPFYNATETNERMQNYSYDKAYVDSLKNGLDYNISIIRSSVNLDIANLISNYNTIALENVSESVLYETRNITNRIMTEMDSKFENIEKTYVSLDYMNNSITIMKNNLTMSINAWGTYFDSRLDNNYYSSIFLALLFSGASAGGVYLYSKKNLTITTKSGLAVRVMDENRKIGTIEEVMTSEEYRKRNEEVWKLIIKTADSRYPENVKIGLVKRIYEGLILGEDALKLAGDALNKELNIKEKLKIRMEKEKHEKKKYPAKNKR